MEPDRTIPTGFANDVLMGVLHTLFNSKKPVYLTGQSSYLVKFEWMLIKFWKEYVNEVPTVICKRGLE